MRNDDSNNGGNEERHSVQSADRHTNYKLFLHLREAGGVKQALGRELHETELKKRGGKVPMSCVKI